MLRVRTLRFLPPLALLLSLALVAVPAEATTYRSISDSALADQASLIAEVEVLSVEAAPTSERPATNYLVEVQSLIKGTAAGSVLVVRAPGGLSTSGLELKIWGAPKFEPDDTALLFLVPRRDGTYGILHLSLGAFRPFRSQGLELALRDLSEAVEMTAPGEAEAAGQRVRDYEAFTAWLRDRSAGQERTADYFLRLPEPRVQSLHDEFNLITYQGRNMRWFDFEEGRSAPWYTHTTPQQGLPGGGIAEVRNSMGLWNRAAGSNIALEYVGTTSADRGLRNPDGFSTVLFNDPFEEMDGNCDEGGVLAIGGNWFDPSVTSTWRGRAYFRILEGDVVTNDGGAGCGYDDSVYFQNVITHEFGHALGFHHSCARTQDGPIQPCEGSHPVLFAAIMRAFANPPRGHTALGIDDERAARALYARPAGPTGPAAPGGLEVTLTKLDALLSWTDNSTDETSFRILRSAGGGTQMTVAEVGADKTVYRDRDLDPDTVYEYQVASVRGGGLGRSSTVTVETPPLIPVTAALLAPSAAIQTGQPVSLEATFTGPVEKMTWEIEPDGLGVREVPCDSNRFCLTHMFTQPGSYSVTAVATGDLDQTGRSAPMALAVEDGGIAFDESESVIQSSLFGQRGDTGTFETNVWLHNAGEDPAVAELAFLQRSLPNPDPTTRRLTVMPGTSLFLPNVVSSVFGEADTSGAIAVRSRVPAGGSAPDLRVISRSFVELSTGAPGSFGQFVGADRPEDLTAHDKVVSGILDGDGFISTFLVVNPEDAPTRVGIRLLDADGTELRTISWGIQARSMRFVRTSSYFETGSAPGPFTAHFSSETGTPFAASFTLLEARSEDQIFLPAADLAEDQESPLYLPRVVRNRGLFDVFLISQLVAYNPSTQPTLLTLEFLERGQDNTSPRSAQRTLSPGQTLLIEDVVQDLFGLSERTGALKVSWQNSTGTAPKLLSFAFADTGGGGENSQRFGMAVGQRTALEAGGASILDFGAEQSDLFKSSYGVVNLGLGGGRVEITLKDGDGNVLAIKERGLRPQQHLELNLAGLFSDTAIGEGRNWIVETRVLVGGPVLTYLASINASGDIFFVPGRATD
ncbi:MAG: hypothetical protein SX243_23230 [Acidobacteriota bacterium]|nr:hypothetical protein [Acidobacteriota bacterium]